MSGTPPCVRGRPRARANVRANVRTLASLALMAAALGCGDDNGPNVTAPPGPPTAATVTAVTASTKTVSVMIGDDATLSATVVGAPGVSQEVVWSSVDAGVARVSAGGVVSGVAAGVTEIIATSKADATKSDRVSVTVRARPGGAVQVGATAGCGGAARGGAARGGAARGVRTAARR